MIKSIELTFNTFDSSVDDMLSLIKYILQGFEIDDFTVEFKSNVEEVIDLDDSVFRDLEIVDEN